MQEFADHMAADVKQLVEDEETGAQSYRYVRTGTDHYSLAFTFDCVAWSQDTHSTWIDSGFHYDAEEHMRNDIRNVVF